MADINPVVSLDNVVVEYGRNRALNGVTAAFPPGAIGLLGPNGAGKSTMIKALLGFLTPKEGQMRVLGIDVAIDPIEIRARIGYMPESDAHIPGVTALQFVTFCGQLSGLPGADSYRFTVKHEPNGVASGYLHERLAVGDQLDIAAPRGTFILDQTRAPVLLISAGIGATPVLAMLHTLAKEHSDRQIWWLHGARSGHEHPFAAEARALLAQLTNVHHHICYSRPDAGDVEGRDFDEAGHLTASLLARLELPADAEAYLCGPLPFMEEISAGLVAIGLDAPRIHTEPFGPAPGLTPGIASSSTRKPHPPTGRPGDGPTIEFARSNLAVPWSSDFASLLEFAEACDVPVRWSCRTGVCHNCETALVAGTVGYDPDPVEPPADGSALICCSRPSENVVLDL